MDACITCEWRLSTKAISGGNLSDSHSNTCISLNSRKTTWQKKGVHTIAAFLLGSWNFSPDESWTVNPSYFNTWPQAETEGASGASFNIPQLIQRIFFASYDWWTNSCTSGMLKNKCPSILDIFQRLRKNNRQLAISNTFSHWLPCISNSCFAQKRDEELGAVGVGSAIGHWQ